MRDIIETTRLSLRPLTIIDAQRVCDLISDFDVSKMLSRAPHPYYIDDAYIWIGSQEGNRSQGSDFVYGITTKIDGLIGVIGLHATERLAQVVPNGLELGYWLGKPFWGQGYATEAGRGLLAAFDTDIKNTSVVAGHFTENIPSGHVLEKLGFHYVGEPGTLFCLARQTEVTDLSMLRPARVELSPPFLNQKSEHS